MLAARAALAAGVALAVRAAVAVGGALVVGVAVAVGAALADDGVAVGATAAAAAGWLAPLAVTGVAVAGVAVTVSVAPGLELSARSPAALIATVIQPPAEPVAQAAAGGFPAQCPTRRPAASLTSTVADAGHCPAHVSRTCSDVDVTCVPLTPTPIPAPDGPENVSAPEAPAPAGYSRRV